MGNPSKTIIDIPAFNRQSSGRFILLKLKLDKENH
jgi:hypothetical protein